MIWLLILLLICYLLGSFPSGSLVAKRWGVADLSQVGSGSIGATNAFRIMGFKPALLVLALDVAKGFVAVCLAYLVWLSPFLFPLVKVTFGLAAIAGHNWSIFSGFKGGKGVATTCGVFLALVPQAVGIAALLWLAVALLTRWASAASLSAALAFPLLAYAYGASWPELILAILAAVLVIFQHRSNLQRLLHGEEEKLDFHLF